MNKSQLVSAIAENAGLSQSKAEQALAAALDVIVKQLSDGQTVSLIGFGNFGVKKRSARKVRNPRTGEEMKIDATLVPYFKAGKNLKEKIESN